MRWNEGIVKNIPDLPLGYYCTLYDTAKYIYSIIRLHPDYEVIDNSWESFPDTIVHYYMYLIYRFQGDIENMISHRLNDPLAFQVLVDGVWKDRFTVNLDEWVEVWCNLQIDIPNLEKIS